MSVANFTHLCLVVLKTPYFVICEIKNYMIRLLLFNFFSDVSQQNPDTVGQMM